MNGMIGKKGNALRPVEVEPGQTQEKRKYPQLMEAMNATDWHLIRKVATLTNAQVKHSFSELIFTLR